MACFGMHPTHVQTCNNVRVQSAAQWTASVHALDMPKPVITFVFKVYAMDCSGVTTSVFKVLHTLRMPKPVVTLVFKVHAMDCFGSYFTHARVGSLRNARNLSQCDCCVAWGMGWSRTLPAACWCVAADWPCHAAIG